MPSKVSTKKVTTTLAKTTNKKTYKNLAIGLTGTIGLLALSKFFYDKNKSNGFNYKTPSKNEITLGINEIKKELRLLVQKFMKDGLIEKKDGFGILELL